MIQLQLCKAQFNGHSPLIKGKIFLNIQIFTYTFFTHKCLHNACIFPMASCVYYYLFLWYTNRQTDKTKSLLAPIDLFNSLNCTCIAGLGTKHLMPPVLVITLTLNTIESKMQQCCFTVVHTPAGTTQST